MKKIITYFCARINERSFWVGVSLAVSAAALLPYPWNIMSFIAGIAGSLIKDGEIKK